MGGRDHSCEGCGRGGFNDPEGRCECPYEAGDQGPVDWRARSQGLEEALRKLIGRATTHRINTIGPRSVCQPQIDVRHLEEARQALSLGLPDEAPSGRPGDCVPGPDVDAHPLFVVSAEGDLQYPVALTSAELDALLRQYKSRDLGSADRKLESALEALELVEKASEPKAAGPERPEVAHRQESRPVGDVSGEGERCKCGYSMRQCGPERCRIKPDTARAD